jgi:hypothetical protein
VPPGAAIEADDGGAEGLAAARASAAKRRISAVTPRNASATVPASHGESTNFIFGRVHCSARPPKRPHRYAILGHFMATRGPRMKSAAKKPKGKAPADDRRQARPSHLSRYPFALIRKPEEVKPLLDCLE